MSYNLLDQSNFIIYRLNLISMPKLCASSSSRVAGVAAKGGAADLCLDVALFSVRALLVVYLGPYRN